MLGQIFDSIRLRNPNSNFFGKGTQKSVSLAEYLKLPVTNLEDIGCPKIQQLLGQEKHICKRHSHLLPSHQLLKHCTRRKSKVFTVLDYFHLYSVQTPGISPVSSVVQSQPGRAATSAGREKTNPFT